MFSPVFPLCAPTLDRSVQALSQEPGFPQASSSIRPGNTVWYFIFLVLHWLWPPHPVPRPGVRSSAPSITPRPSEASSAATMTCGSCRGPRGRFTSPHPSEFHSVSLSLDGSELPPRAAPLGPLSVTPAGRAAWPGVCRDTAFRRRGSRSTARSGPRGSGVTGEPPATPRGRAGRADRPGRP